MHTLFTSLYNKVLFGQSTLPFNPFQFRPLILNRTHLKPREATVNIYTNEMYVFKIGEK